MGTFWFMETLVSMQKTISIVPPQTRGRKYHSTLKRTGAYAIDKSPNETHSSTKVEPNAYYTDSRYYYTDGTLLAGKELVHVSFP